MSYGKMRHDIRIVQTVKITDAEGFTSEQEIEIATVKAAREGRHGTEKWARMAQYTDATDIFRIRYLPGVNEDCKIILGADRYDITSVEDVRGRGMYLEITARKVVMRHG